MAKKVMKTTDGKLVIIDSTLLTLIKTAAVTFFIMFSLCFITLGYISTQMSKSLDITEKNLIKLKNNVDSLKCELEFRDKVIKVKDSQLAQNCIISYYGEPFHGRKTASGTVYNMYDMTVAHKTLPFGTKVLITNPKTNKSVIAIVTDRGPFIKNRIFDVSYGVAKKINMVTDGVIIAKISLIT